jgi:hypothetical protein
MAGGKSQLIIGNPNPGTMTRYACSFACCAAGIRRSDIAVAATAKSAGNAGDVALG